MTAGLAILAAGLIGFALTAGWTLIVFGLLVVAMLGLGVAMLMIGKNSIAFAGLLTQIDNLSTGSFSNVDDLADAIESVGDSLSNISMVAMFGLGVAMLMIGKNSAASVGHLGQIEVAILGLGVAMLMIGKDSAAFVGLLGQIDNLTTDSISKVNELAAAIESVGDSLSNISMPGAIVLTMLLQEIGDVAEHAPKVTPAVSANIEKLVGAAAEYSEIKWSFFGLAGLMADPFVNMLKAAVGVGATGGAGAGGAGGAGGPGGTGGGGNNGGGGGTATTVVLELDGVVLGRTVEAVLNKRQRLRTAVD